jgi:hypothetical protein
VVRVPVHRTEHGKVLTAKTIKKEEYRREHGRQIPQEVTGKQTTDI